MPRGQVMDFETRVRLAEHRRKKRGIKSPAELRVEQAHQDVEAFNARYPLGTAVTYWTFVREGTGRKGVTRSTAQVSASGTAMVWVTGQPGYIALTHVQPDVVLD